LLLSFALAIEPDLPWRAKGYGIPVRDYIFQSTLFVICVFALAGYACDALRERRWLTGAGLWLWAAAFFANIMFVATSRTVLIVTAVLVVLLGWRQFGWKGAVGAVLFGALLGSAVWFGSSYLRARVMHAIE